MSLTKKRKPGGGRKPVTVINPFLIFDEGTVINELDAKEDSDLTIEDIILGCIRSFNADNTRVRDVVNYSKVLNIYRSLEIITRPIVQEFLDCSKSQAEMYIRVIKLCNVFLVRRNKATITGYIDLTQDQVEAGQLLLLRN